MVNNSSRLVKYSRQSWWTNAIEELGGVGCFLKPGAYHIVGEAMSTPLVVLLQNALLKGDGRELAWS